MIGRDIAEYAAKRLVETGNAMPPWTGLEAHYRSADLPAEQPLA